MTGRKKHRRTLRIALIGTRGVPARYGGFETCVEELGRRLAERGHEVTVYCRPGYYRESMKSYLGMRLVHLPSLNVRFLETLSHTFFSIVHGLKERYDIYMVFNAANSLLTFPLRLFSRNIIINTDGLEWKREKWGPAGKMYYRMSEKFACLLANRLVSDSRGIQDYYRKRHGTDSTRIVYGADIPPDAPPRRIFQWGLEPGGYFLQITRFEPENNPLLTLQAFSKLDTDKKMVLVGGNPYPTAYTDAIESLPGKNIVRPGFVYEKDLLQELWQYCYAYIHGNEVGGTNPALLQSMAAGSFILARDVAFNREVLGDCGIFYGKNEDSLFKQMMWTLDHEPLLARFRSKARKRVRENYSWDEVAESYENLFCQVYDGRFPWKPFPRKGREATGGNDE